jgi:hypothetical protein
VVELRDIQLPESMQRAMARQAEAEREKRAKIIAAQGEALAAGELAIASDLMMAHPLALQLRNLQTLVEVAVDKNSTVVFPAPLMSTIAELGAVARAVGRAVGAFFFIRGVGHVAWGRSPDTSCSACSLSCASSGDDPLAHAQRSRTERWPDNHQTSGA